MEPRREKEGGRPRIDAFKGCLGEFFDFLYVLPLKNVAGLPAGGGGALARRV